MVNEAYLKTIKTTLNELPFRLKSLSKYYAFFEVLRAKYYIDECKGINTGEICMGLISFLFYEGKLKSHAITFSHIQDFLGMYVNELYGINLEGDILYKFTNATLDLVQGVNGTGFEISFPKSLPRTSFVKYVSNFSRENNSLKEYELTSDAIDFFLETKEFGEESKITISLLILKKLVEHNEYDSALLSLTTVNAEVIKQISKVYEIEMNLLYGGNIGYQNFLEYRDLANKRQVEEESLFKETMDIIKTLREDYSTVLKSELSEKELNAFRCLDEMDKELIKTVELHQQLLGKIILLSCRAEEILRRKKINLLRPSFDFVGYLDKLGSANNVESLAYLSAPFVPLNIQKGFSINKINDMVNFNSTNKSKESIVFDSGEIKEINTDKFNKDISERVLYNYNSYLNLFYDLLKNRESIKMSEIISIANSSFIENMFKNPDFIGIVIDFLRLNEDSVLSLNKSESKDKSSLLEKALDTIYKERYESFELQIESIKDSYIEIAPGFNMTDVIIKKIVKGG